MRNLTVFVVTWWLAVTPEYSSCGAQSTKRKRRHKKAYDGDARNDQPRFEYFFSAKHDAIQQYVGGPKHLWEGVVNTIVVSGSSTLAGIVSVFGLPLLALSSQDEVMNDNMGRIPSRVLRLMVGTITGVVVAGTSWTFAAVYGIWQTAVGLYRTPACLMAQVQRKCYYNYTDGKWQRYNLTNHFAILSESGSGYSRAVSILDDSFYKILKVATNASQKEIKSAYYKLAKEYHPDKMSTEYDKEAVNERFLALHRAYETLHSPEQRRKYDEGGNSSKESLLFDTDVFFDVFFGFSPELELYTGDLAIKSVAANVVHLVGSVQASFDSGSVNQEHFLNELFSTFLWKSQDRRDLRQLEVALHLQDFIAPFVYGEIDLESFSHRCAHEANKIKDSTSFPLFLKSIGKALYWQGRRTITSVVDIPTAVMAWTREGAVGFERWTWLPIAFAQLIRETNHHVANANNWLETQKQTRYSDKEWHDLRLKKIIEDLLPSLTAFVWDFNARDITDALDGACWKLLHTSTTLSRTERKRQVQALEELGSSFIRVADSWEYNRACTGAKEKNCDVDIGGARDHYARIKWAMEMAIKS